MVYRNRTNIIWEIWFIWATFLCWGQWLMVLVRLRTKHFNCLVNGCRKSGNSGQNCRQCRCFTFLFKVTDGGCTDTGIRCTHAENRRHGMWVNGNGNRRKPGSEASVGCNEVKTWPTWPVRHSHTRGRILWSFWEPVSALRQISNKDTNNPVWALYSLHRARVMSFVGPGPGGWREEAFPAFEETVTRSQQQRTDWVLRVLSDPHKYALSVGSDDQPYPLLSLRILTSLSCFMLITLTHGRNK